MDPKQLAELIEKINRGFEEFKQTNDNRLKLLEKQGTAGADREEKVDRMSAAIDGLVDQVKALQTAANRAPQGDGKAQDPKEVEAKARTAAFEKMLRKGVEFMTPEERKALATDSDPQGGYLVPVERSAEIVKKLFETSAVRMRAGVVTIGTGEWEELAVWDEASVETPGERGTRNETDTPDLSMLKIPTHFLAAQPQVTQAMLDDAGFNVESFLEEYVADKMARTENTWFCSGTGVNQARGFLSYDHGTGYGQVERVASGTSGDFDGDDLMEIQGALFEQFQPGATWAMARATRTKVRKFKDGNGQYLWSLDKGLNGAVQETLLGKPLDIWADMPAVGANALAVAYGDFRQGYRIVDRMGIRVIRDFYTKPGWVKLNFSRRVGGAVRNFQAIKLLRLAASTT